MIRGLAQSAARSRNMAKLVVALLVVLGTRTVEAPTTNTLTTAGWRAWGPANVSPTLTTCRSNILQTKQWLFSCSHVSVLTNFHIRTLSISHDNDDHGFRMSQMRHHREIWENELLRSQWFLVQKLRRCWQRQTRSHVVRGHPGLRNTVAVQGSHRPTVERGSTAKHL